MARHALPAQRRPSRSASFTIPQWALLVFLILAALATLAGLIGQWPGKQAPRISPDFAATSGVATPLVSGEVTEREEGLCDSPSIGTAFDGAPKTTVNFENRTCPRAIVRLESGPNADKNTLIMLGTQPGDPTLKTGEKIWLTETAANGTYTYSFADVHRTSTLTWWLIAVTVLIVAVGMHRGVLSLVGLGTTMAMVGFFLLPALLRGGSPIGLAVTGGAAVLFLVLFLVHGISWKTASALGGTLIALGLAAVLARFAIHGASLRGLGHEDNLHIQLYLPDVSVTGLMLCGFIIGALGVLNDVTVAQASTVQELVHADASAPAWSIFTSAMRVGRDHIASMVYTLVLSYTGAALPSLLLLSVSGRPLGQMLTGDIMATEFLRSAVGAMALVLAVPITTAVAAVTVRK
ncbi:YibE/F family protein [Corynebacterium epidermidicanis]|uniref:Putative multitransmembrane protein n=1 Tax=Corynebacterium epidermidicanis TaxID=1050174 RepID=A0A0G3GSJ2_9CORY|nr:YibE/F family protein [Corynebacterium epidermidicanis]AKK04104.1 putative multitransmembrane protein [Corynebacterium epidermidicanis]